MLLILYFGRSAIDSAASAGVWVCIFRAFLHGAGEQTQQLEGSTAF
jgi:hypothetical protein